MGKLLELLRWREGGRAPILPLPPRPPAAVDAVLPLRAETEPDAAEEEYLFIEVGGPDKKVDGSPAVLAATPEPGAQVRARDKLKVCLTNHVNAKQSPPSAKPDSAPAAAPVLRKAAPMSVAFEPWPADRQRPSYVAPEIITYHQPEHPASKQYAELFRNVTDGLGESPVLLFSGATAKSGTTMVLLNLAVSGCRQQRRIALVETQLSRPALAERLGLQAAPGWHELLAGKIGLEKALHSTAQPDLHVLVAGAASQRLSEKGSDPSAAQSSTLTPEAYRWILGWLRQRFDLVLLDAPEIRNESALSLLIPPTDAMYLVLPQSWSDAGQFSDLAQTVMRLDGRLRGLIHTQFETL